jgi:hypothetical protein
MQFNLPILRLHKDSLDALSVDFSVGKSLVNWDYIVTLAEKIRKPTGFSLYLVIQIPRKTQKFFHLIFLLLFRLFQIN